MLPLHKRALLFAIRAQFALEVGKLKVATDWVRLFQVLGAELHNLVSHGVFLVVKQDLKLELLSNLLDFSVQVRIIENSIFF